MDDPDTSIFLPMELDAFIINRAVCEYTPEQRNKEPPVRISLITRPEYAGLRIDGKSTVHDLLPRVTLPPSTSASLHPRVCDYDGTWDSTEESIKARRDGSNINPERTGVHLSWRLPRCYRVGYNSAPKPTKSVGTDGEPIQDDSKTKYGLDKDTQQRLPQFPDIPNRWLVIRRLMDSTPWCKDVGQKNVELWIVESDKQWNLNEIPLDLDIEMNMSPVVSVDAETGDDQLRANTQQYIGRRVTWKDWQESDTKGVPVSSVTGSNPYFLDAAMHNINVLSIFDDLSYVDTAGKKLYYQQATADYVVLGFHAHSQNDPLGGKENVYGGAVEFGDKEGLTARLSAMGVKISAEELDRLIKGHTDYPDGNLRTHPCGKIRSVTFDSTKAPTNNKAKVFATALTNQIATEPIAVGTTAIDAFMSLLEANSKTLGPEAMSAVRYLQAMQELRFARDGDDYNSRIKANDFIQGHIYRDFPGEEVWRLDSATSKILEKDPGDSALDTLRKLNDQQRLHAAAGRNLRIRQWLLFAEFFKFVASPSIEQSQEAKQRARDRIKSIKKDIEGLLGVLQSAYKNILDSTKAGYKKAAGNEYSQRKDPSITLAGLKISGVQAPDNKLAAYTMDGILDHFEKILPVQFDITYPDADNEITPYIHRIISLFGDPVDEGGHENFAKNVPDTQAWSPLYVEWEVEYWHIPIERWKVEARSRGIGTNHSHLHYHIADSLHDKPLDEEKRRRFVGRSTLVPQVGFNLRTLIEEILRRRPADSKPEVTAQTEAEKKAAKEAAEKTQLETLTKIEQLEFASATLTGFTANLLTRASGTHVKPNLRQDGNVVALEAAIAAVKDAIGMTKEDLQMIMEESGQTPYGDLVDFDNNGPDPFIGLTSGQFVIKKLDIVDKFGQVVTAPQPRLSGDTNAKDSADHVHPCISDLLSPTTVDGHFNTVLPCTEMDSEDHPLCPFVQIPPSINQPARINVDFVVPVSASNGHANSWRATTEHENPVWGWIVINFADQGLQIYNHKGIFISEFRFGGYTGVQKGPKWLPFKPPQARNDLISLKLHDLLQRMADDTHGEEFNKGLWDTIKIAVETTPYAPAEYATGTSAIIGKPLALVDVGVSFELSHPPHQAQNSCGPSRTKSEADILCEVEFDYKIGDIERPYDGVIGYFNCSSDDSAIDLSRIYAPLGNASGKSLEIYDMTDVSNLDKAHPYWIDPTIDFAGMDRSFSQQHYDQYRTHVKSVIVDPYAAIHVYSGILPTVSVTLPQTFVQSTLTQMTAFYTAGPMALPKDVPDTYNQALQAGIISWVKRVQDLAESKDEPPVRLPFKAIKGDWLWLQPYTASKSQGPEAENAPEWDWRQFDAFEVGAESTAFAELQSPPTLVEGFLQLARPLTRPTI